MYYNLSKTLLEYELSKSNQWNVLFCEKVVQAQCFPAEIHQSFTSILCLQPAAYLYHLTIDTRVTYITKLMNHRERSAMALKIALKTLGLHGIRPTHAVDALPLS